MAIDKRSYLTGRNGYSVQRNGSQLFIEAWMRITLMELPLSPTEERITAAFVEALMKEGKNEENSLYAS